MKSQLPFAHKTSPMIRTIGPLVDWTTCVVSCTICVSPVRGKQTLASSFTICRELTARGTSLYEIRVY